MRITCDRCLRRYDIPDGSMGGRKIRARCKCGSRIVIHDRSVTTDGPDSAADSKQHPTRWFVDITSWEPIAMDARQLVRAFAAGRIDADTLVWCKGMPDWRRLRDVDELAERLLGVASGATTRTTKPPRPTPVEGTEPARAPGARRSITPRASYVVASAGDTMRLKRPEQSELAPAEGTPLAERTLAAAVLSAAVLSEGLSTSAAADADAASEPPAALVPAGFSADAAEPSSEGSQRPSEIPPPLPVAQSNANTAPGPSQPEPSIAAAEPAPVSAANTTRAASTKSEPASAGRGTQQQRQRKRRRSVSEETPAQKPSSLSVRLTTPPRHRGRSVLAAAGVLAIIGFIWQASIERSAKHSLVPSIQENPHEDAPPAEPRPLEEPRVPDVVAERAKEQEPPAAPSAEATEAPNAPPIVPEAKAKQSLLPSPVQPQNNVPRPPAPAPAPKRAEPARRAAPPPTPAKAPPAVAAAATTETSPAAEAAAPSEAAVAANQEEANSAPKPGPFDTAKAEQQMAVAAWVASTCGQMGETRGEGQVKVLIEPWGRVVRVTHLAPEFAGTPVGHCVTQAYQQITIPPFEGGTRSLVGTFVIK